MKNEKAEEPGRFEWSVITPALLGGRSKGFWHRECEGFSLELKKLERRRIVAVYVYHMSKV